MTNIEPSEPKEMKINKKKLANSADEMQKAAVTAAIAGQEEAALGAQRMQDAGELMDAGTGLMAQGASDVTRAVDEKIVAERLAVLSETVAVAGVTDIAEGAAMLSHSEDVGVMSALVGMMSEDDLEHGLELARLSGELQTASELVNELKMPVLSSFLIDRAERLHDMSIEQIRVAISTEGISQLLASSGTRIGELGENEVAEGMTRVIVSDAVSERGAALNAASQEHAVQGMEEMIVGGEIGQAAKKEARQGAAEISAGSAVVGAAVAVDEMAKELKNKSEQ